jgi:hypothetical protein
MAGSRLIYAYSVELKTGFAFLALILSACASAPRDMSSPPEDWRLVPEATVLGERRQFFVYGRHLDSARVSAHPSVTSEKGWLNPEGTVLSLYLKVERIEDDSTALGEKPGLRRITVKTPDTSVTLKLKVMGEVPR